jgi:MFS transporter, ACS family, hexuronate transporter
MVWFKSIVAVLRRNIRWSMIGLIMLGSIINYLTRSSLSVAVAGSTMLHDLSISTQQYSWIVNCFQGAIMLQPICGYVLDVLGLRFGLAIFVFTWALTNMANALAGSWQALAGMRALMGFAEGSANPSGVRATAEWFPAKERGLAAGVFNIGASAGSMIAPPLVAWAILAYNWRMAFVVTGALGLAWVVLWLLLYRSPDQSRALTAEERQYIVAGQEKHLQAAGAKPSVWNLIRRRNLWGIALPRFLADPTWGVLQFWLPLYFKEVHHFDLKHIAMFVWLPFLGADIGCLFGGWLAMTLQKRARLSIVNSRRCTFSLGALLMLGVVCMGFVKNPYTAVALMTLAGFAHQTLSVTVITMASDLFRKNEVGTVAGMAGTLGNAGLLIFNTLIGILVVRIGYTPFFVCLGLFDIIGAIILWTVVREPDLTEAPAAR